MSVNDKEILLKTDDKFICSEKGIFINIALSNYEYEFLVVYHGKSNDRKVSYINIFQPEYLFDSDKMSDDDKSIFIDLINKYWNFIKYLYKTEYSNKDNPDYDIYQDSGKGIITISENPIDYRKL